MERPGWKQWGHELQAGDLWAWLWTRPGLGNLPASGAWGCPDREILPQTQPGPPWCLQWPCWPVPLSSSARRRNTWWQAPFSTVNFFDGCGQGSQAELQPLYLPSASLLHSLSIKQRERKGTHSSVSQGAEDKHIKLCHAVRCCVCAGTRKITSLESQPLLLSNQQDRSDYVSPFASFRNRFFPPGWEGKEEPPLLCFLHWRQQSPSDELQVQTGLHLFTRNCCQDCCDGASQSTHL